MHNTPVMTDTDLWTYRDYESWQGSDISGFSVEAIDGEIGSVAQATYDVASSFLVVDTGPWIFGKKVMLPAGVIDRVDMNDHRVFVHRTKEEIKNAPEFDEANFRDQTYRSDLGTYYGRGGAGYREWNS